MPKAMELALKKKAKRMGLAGERANKYIYGTMRKTGWTPTQQNKKNPMSLKDSVASLLK